MERLKKLFKTKENDTEKTDSNNVKDTRYSDYVKDMRWTEELKERFSKTISYDFWLNWVSFIEFGKWELQQEWRDWIYVWKFKNWLTIIMRKSCYITVTIHRKWIKRVDKFYLDSISEAFFLMRWIVYGSTNKWNTR